MYVNICLQTKGFYRAMTWVNPSCSFIESHCVDIHLGLENEARGSVRCWTETIIPRASLCRLYFTRCLPTRHFSSRVQTKSTRTTSPAAPSSTSRSGTSPARWTSSTPRLTARWSSREPALWYLSLTLRWDDIILGFKGLLVWDQSTHHLFSCAVLFLGWLRRGSRAVTPHCV